MLIWALAATAGIATRAVWPTILCVVPEPSGAPPAKIPYRALAGSATAWAAAGFVVLACLALLWVPAHLRPAWVGLATLGPLLGVIDARTTWLPLPITHVLWAVTAAGVGLLAVSADLGAVFRAGVAALAIGTFFWAFWRFTGGLGFGDVRLAPVIGAAAGAISPTHAFAAVLLGTGLGATLGIVRALTGRRGPFAYGPSLLAGPFLALVVLRLIG